MSRIPTVSGSSSRFSGSARVLLLAVFFALFTGIVEAGRFAALRFAFERLTWLPAQTMWMAPVAYLIFFAIPAALLYGVYMLSPRRPLWPAVLAFATLSAFSLGMLFGRDRLNAVAIVLLVAGAAVQVARMAREHEAGFWRFIRGGTAVLTLTTVLLYGITETTNRLARQPAADQVMAAPIGARNVLFIILDTVRSASLSLQGYERRTTPNLERWAQRGVVFETAFATAPWTLPSHATMFTGRWPHELSAGWLRPLNDEYPTLAEELLRRGYQTGGFVSNLIYTTEETGLDRGFTAFQAHKPSVKQLLLTSGLGQTVVKWRFHPVFPKSDRKRARAVTDEFLAWHSSAASDRPFFAFLNYFDAHLPYVASTEFRQLLKHEDPLVQGYDAAIAHLDAELNRLFLELERRGALANTLVVVTSDHGELLGEHGLTEHANSLYLPLLHVPLVIWGPGVPSDVRIAQPVSLRDLPRTIVDLAVGESEFPGHSLAATWGGDSVATSPPFAELTRGIRTTPDLPVSRGAMKSLIADGYHYILNGDGVRELYEIRRDPGELRDLADTHEGRVVLTRLSPILQNMAGARHQGARAAAEMGHE